MARDDRRLIRRARLSAIVVAFLTVGAATVGSTAPAGAQASKMTGGAFGHYTKVGLFGGPQGVVGPAPDVRLSPTAADRPLTASEPQAAAVYGPAHIFGGKWPIDVGTAPPSGPITVSTKVSGGSVTSTADIVLFPTPMPVQCDGQPPGTTNCKAPGGYGPFPSTGDEMHSTCTASESGATGSTRLVNGTLATSTDQSGEPKDQENVPENPPPNYTRFGEITNVGDKFKIVYNEQFVEPDGSITVNAEHMYLLGAIAVGDQILGQVRCSVHGAAFANTPAPPANTPAPPTTLVTKTKSDSTSVAPFVIGGIVAIAVIALLAFVNSHRRKEPEAEPEPEPGPGTVATSPP